MAPKRNGAIAMKKLTQPRAMKRSRGREEPDLRPAKPELVRMELRSSESAMKRARREEPDGRSAKLDLVKMTLRSPETVIPSPEARKLLLGSIDVALKGEQDGRHEFQTSVAKMIESTLENHRKHLEAELAAKSKFLFEEAGETKVQLQSKVQETEKAIVAKKAEIEEKNVTKTQDDAAQEHANVGLEKAKAGERQLRCYEGRSQLIAVYEQSFGALRENAGPTKMKEATKLKGQLTLMLKSMGGCAKRRDHAPGSPQGLAITKTPKKSRGDFDNKAISAVGQLFTKIKTGMNEKFALHDEEAARTSAAISEAQMATDTTQQKLTTTIELLGAAQTDLKELEKQLKLANAEVTKHDKKVAKTGAELEKYEEKIQEFAKVEVAFDFLNTYSTKKVQPEEEAEQQGEEEEEEEKKGPEMPKNEL